MRTLTQVMVGGWQVASSAQVALASFATEQEPVVSVTVIVGPSSTAGVTAAGTSVAGAQNLRMGSPTLVGPAEHPLSPRTEQYL